MKTILVVTGLAGERSQSTGQLDLVDLHKITTKTKVLWNMFTTFPYHEDQLTNPKPPIAASPKKGINEAPFFYKYRLFCVLSRNV